MNRINKALDEVINTALKTEQKIKFIRIVLIPFRNIINIEFVGKDDKHVGFSGTK